MRFRVKQGRKEEVVWSPCENINELEEHLTKIYGSNFIWCKEENLGLLLLQEGMSVQAEPTKELSLIPKDDVETSHSVFEKEDGLFVLLPRQVAIPISYLNLDNFYILDGEKELRKDSFLDYMNKVKKKDVTELIDGIIY